MGELLETNKIKKRNNRVIIERSKENKANYNPYKVQASNTLVLQLMTNKHSYTQNEKSNYVKEYPDFSEKT